MKDERPDSARSEPGPEHWRLKPLVGKWHTTGRTNPTESDPGAEIDAVDTYEWLPGGFGLLHVVDAQVGDQRVEGAEVIGHDPARGTYITLYVGSDGPTSYEAQLAEQEGSLVWRMKSATTHFTGVFDEERTTIVGHWELLGDDESWLPWMEITLTKT
jgi:Protein of unknown function (DUF1579)